MLDRMRRSSRLPGPYLIHAELVREWVPSWDAYPFRLPAVRHLTKLEFHPKVTFLVGENGSGKSTLMEAVAVGMGLNPEGGSRNFNFATRASHSELVRKLRLARHASPPDAFFLRAESYFNVATQVDELGVIDSYGGKSLHEQSHGESFFALFQHRLGGPGLYLFDEPEAALSPRRQMEFLALLHDRVRAGAQFIIATHSPILMALPGARILEFAGDRIRPVAFDDVEHVRITRSFLAQPASFLERLRAADAPDPD